MKYQFDTEVFLNRIRDCELRKLDLDQVVAFEKILPLSQESQKMREVIICEEYANISEALASEEITFSRVEKFIAMMMVEEGITLKV